MKFGIPQATNFISVCQKNFPCMVENLGVRQAKKVIGLVAAYVEASISGHNK